MCLFEKAHNKARKAAKIIEKLVTLRKSQSKEGTLQIVDPITLGKVEYDMLTVPFLYKAGDTLSSYIESNTDEFNNMKPFEFEDSSDEEEGDDAGDQDDEGEEDGETPLN